MIDKLLENILNLFDNPPKSTIYLNQKEWDGLQELLENPPEPNEKLKKLLSKEKTSS